MKIQSIIVNKCQITDELQIADYFNHFFSNVAEELSRQIPVNQVFPTLQLMMTVLE